MNKLSTSTLVGVDNLFITGFIHHNIKLNLNHKCEEPVCEDRLFFLIDLKCFIVFLLIEIY